MTTEQLLHRVIGDVREQQVTAQAAIKLCAKDKYTEAKTLVICSQVLNEIDKILRTAEMEIK